MVRHNGDQILSVVRDITERMRADQALQDLVAGTAVTGKEFFQLMFAAWQQPLMFTLLAWPS